MTISMGRIGFAGELPPGVSKVSVCKFCEAPIYWCWSAEAKRVPVDAVPDERGMVTIGVGGVISLNGEGPRYIVHFTNCPGGEV